MLAAWARKRSDEMQVMLAFLCPSSVAVSCSGSLDWTHHRAPSHVPPHLSLRMGLETAIS